MAIGVGDWVGMLQFSTYSVISPEGCASILWKSADKAQLAAEAMAITSEKLLEQGLIDQIIKEPLGGAHRNPDVTAASIKAALIARLDALSERDPAQLVAQRYDRLMGFGKFKDDRPAAR